ncbi:heterokaryon incompatibility protein-domain-containing protein [Nemania sp. FL0031]|nr:heterokaryon incompatibility protein-domain-containing protein [Nemania sp. FL0031]
MSMRLYPASKLGPRSFRLLQISRSKEGVHECRLSEHSIDHPPRYIPVSYTWGPSEVSEVASQQSSSTSPHHPPNVLLNGTVWEITPSLSELLHALFSTPANEREYLWVDALCINQGDVKERTDQVNLMCRIYSQGAFVFVWLGPANEHTTKVLTMISQLAKTYRALRKQDDSMNVLNAIQNLSAADSLRLLGLDERTTSDDWIAFDCFYRRRWFFRVWTIQEFALSSAVVGWWGVKSINWEELFDTARLILNSSMIIMLGAVVQGQSAPVKDVSYSIPIYYLAGDLVKPRRAAELEHSQEFNVWLRPGSKRCAAASVNFLVISARVFRATDPLDRVFAFFGVWEKIAKQGFGEKFDVKADYKKTTRVVYTEFMTTVLLRTGSLNFLSSVQPSHGQDGIKGLPSWVPDYSTIIVAPIIQYLSTRIPLRNIDAHANTRLCPPLEGRHRIFDYRLKFDWSPRKQTSLTNRRRVFDIRGNELTVPSLVFGTVIHIGSSYSELLDSNFEKTLSMLLLSPQKYPDGRSRLQAFHSMLMFDNDLPPISRFRTLWIFLFIRQICVRWQRSGIHAEEYLEEVGIPRFLKIILENGENPYFPTFTELKATLQNLGYWKRAGGDDNSVEMQEMLAEIGKLDSHFRNTYVDRRPFLLDNGYFGMTGQDVEPGDTIRIVPDGRAFFAFRKIAQQAGEQDRYVLIGESYVSGTMAGEASDYIKQTERQWETICVI